MVAGLIPPLANAAPNDAGLTDGSLKDSEKLGREAQRELARLGCFSGNVDDGWGREGRAAVKRLNQAAQIAWPDWPTADLVSALRTYVDGYCQKCRDGDACATGATKLEQPPREEIQTEKPTAVVPAEKPSAATPVEDQEPIPPAEPQIAKTEPQAIPEVSTETPDVVDDQPPTSKAEKAPENEDDREAPVNRPASQPKRTKPPKQVVGAGPKPAEKSEAPSTPPPHPPQRSPRGGLSGGGWPGSGPNLDGR